jgi:hypothetical protein
MSSTPGLTPRAREMYALIEQYLSRPSATTQKAFCEAEGIPLSTFQWWFGKYREAKDSSGKAGSSSGEFIPLKVEAPKHKAADCANQWEILYPNGVILRIGNEIDIDLLSSLVTCVER